MMQTVDRDTLPASGQIDKFIPVVFPGADGATVTRRVPVAVQTTVLDLARSVELAWPSHFVADIGGQLLTGGQPVYDAIDDASAVYLVPDQARVG